MSKTKKKYGPDIYKRNEHGLLENVDYTFKEDGSIDWRAMIKPEFLYPNKENRPIYRAGLIYLKILIFY